MNPDIDIEIEFYKQGPTYQNKILTKENNKFVLIKKITFIKM